jgi:hypothetical protein
MALVISIQLKLTKGERECLNRCLLYRCKWSWYNIRSWTCSKCKSISSIQWYHQIFRSSNYVFKKRSVCRNCALVINSITVPSCRVCLERCCNRCHLSIYSTKQNLMNPWSNKHGRKLFKTTVYIIVFLCKRSFTTGHIQPV